MFCLFSSSFWRRVETGIGKENGVEKEKRQDKTELRQSLKYIKETREKTLEERQEERLEFSVEPDREWNTEGGDSPIREENTGTRDSLIEKRIWEIRKRILLACVKWGENLLLDKNKEIEGNLRENLFFPRERFVFARAIKGFPRAYVQKVITYQQ